MFDEDVSDKISSELNPLEDASELDPLEDLPGDADEVERAGNILDYFIRLVINLLVIVLNKIHFWHPYCQDSWARLEIHMQVGGIQLTTP